MPEKCPNCGQPMPQSMIEKLRAWCRDNGKHILPGDRVSEKTAAEILGRSPGALRNWRSNGGEVVQYIRTGGGHGRISYSLESLANYLQPDEINFFT